MTFRHGTSWPSLERPISSATIALFDVSKGAQPHVRLHSVLLVPDLLHGLLHALGDHGLEGVQRRAVATALHESERRSAPQRAVEVRRGAAPGRRRGLRP